MCLASFGVGAVEVVDFEIRRAVCTIYQVVKLPADGDEVFEEVVAEGAGAAC